MGEQSTTATDRDETVLAGLMVASGVIFPGILKYMLTAAGYSFLGTVAWACGFGGVALAFWFRFIRPLDLTGPE
ncbi:hypothetical protein [Haloarchaeobius amylolyticus]|uniref:hypothetical protein n=1 Tax=Haloarchaeobius amylolyticus TaxID=1198296 RepID=UPI00226FDAA0|nr:hypothetical protein [Haloarchaeobius amylolyticus]